MESLLKQCKNKHKHLFLLFIASLRSMTLLEKVFSAEYFGSVNVEKV